MKLYCACQRGGCTYHDVEAECYLSQGRGERGIECLRKHGLLG